MATGSGTKDDPWVLKTPPGSANLVANALDNARVADIAGTIAGDNTILIIAREGVPGRELRDELRAYLTEGAA